MSRVSSCLLALLALAFMVFADGGTNSAFAPPFETVLPRPYGHVQSLERSPYRIGSPRAKAIQEWPRNLGIFDFWDRMEAGKNDRADLGRLTEKPGQRSLQPSLSPHLPRDAAGSLRSPLRPPGKVEPLQDQFP